MGYRPDNPVGDVLGQALVQHMRALPHDEVADAITTVWASKASVTTRRAFEFLVLTAARSGEVRLATWNEMDLDERVWTIPAARMKAKRDHRVPLSARAMAILTDAGGRREGTGLVFPNPRGKPLSDKRLSKLIKALGIAAVPHGFRSSFRDWAAEHTNTPREVVEAALAHAVRNPTEAAYARSDLFARRRRLMDDLGRDPNQTQHKTVLLCLWGGGRGTQDSIPGDLVPGEDDQGNRGVLAADRHDETPSDGGPRRSRQEGVDGARQSPEKPEGPVGVPAIREGPWSLRLRRGEALERRRFRRNGVPDRQNQDW